MKISFQQVQQNVASIANREHYNRDFLFELMAAYGRSTSSITKLRTGIVNLANYRDTEVLQRNVVYFKHIQDGKLLPEIEKLKQNPLTTRYNPRYLIVTDFSNLAAIDTKKGNTLDIRIQDIDRHIDFFYGWTGDEVTDEKTEAVADRRAAEKMTELYSEIAKINSAKLNEKNSTFNHDLNVFFSRLLFCYFAEDTRVFSKDETSMFTSSIKDFTQTDGEDLDIFLETLFRSFDEKDKSRFTSPFSKFPYVNGGLFSKERKIAIPKFNAKARKIMIECGSLKWNEINPDIFGSMFQGVVDEVYRSDHGMHYTSVPNIMKTIEPLFLDELRDEFDKNFDNPKKLAELLKRIAKIKIFDPACGSGNFLIIAYKELRKLEHAILERLLEGKMHIRLASNIKLENFYGIEIDDFACEVAQLSLHIAKHQMDIEFEKQFGKEIELIPLTDAGKIVHGNAARIDWQEVCPNKPHYQSNASVQQTKLIPDEYEQRELIDLKNEKAIYDEIYLIGNPPYQGSKVQDDLQKEDMKIVFQGIQKFSNLDYVACWFYKAAKYLEKNTKASFVSTNSINQGTLVDDLWPHIFGQGIEIDFAIKDFLWTNSAKNKAGVMCSVIGFSKSGKNREKFIQVDNVKHIVKNINGYLIDSPNVFVKKRTMPLSDLPEMNQGNIPLDNGNLRLTDQERNEIVLSYPSSEGLFKRATGSQELVNNIKRWCLWISDSQLDSALSIFPIKTRIEKVQEFRSKGAENALACMDRSHQFCMINTATKTQIVIPIVTSIKRDYIPISLISSDYIVMNSALVIYDPELYVFGLLNSRMHISWVKAFAGKLKSDFRYSIGVCWYSFPVPLIEVELKSQIEMKARQIIFARESHSEKTLAEMYDPDKMPEDLRRAHHELDIVVDKIYRDKPYENDEERLSDLFALYEKMIKEEEVRNGKRNN